MMSVCPGETGNASATTNASSLASRTRSCGMSQNGQLLGPDSVIVGFYALLAGSPDSRQIVFRQQSPEGRDESHERHVALVADELAALEFLERHPQYDSLHFVVLQVLDPRQPRADALNREAALPAFLIERAERACDGGHFCPAVRIHAIK